jgi:arsenate reductase-like glutaredoxin family protein
MNQTKEEKMKELKNVVIYTKDHCPFSKRVKEYLTSEKVDFKQIRVDDDPKTYDELKKKPTFKLFRKFLWMENSLVARLTSSRGLIAKEQTQK